MLSVAVEYPVYGEEVEVLFQLVPLLVLTCHLYARLSPVAVTENEAVLLPQVLTLTGFISIPGLVLIVIIELSVLVVELLVTEMFAVNEALLVSKAFIVYVAVYVWLGLLVFIDGTLQEPFPPVILRVNEPPVDQFDKLKLTLIVPPLL